MYFDDKANMNYWQMRCGCERDKSGMTDSKVFDLSNTDEHVTNLGKTKYKTSLGKKISWVLTILDLNPLNIHMEVS